MLQRELQKTKPTPLNSVRYLSGSAWRTLPPRTSAGTAPRKSSNSIQRRQIEKSANRTLEEVTDLTIPIDNIKRRIDRDLQVISECSELPVATARIPKTDLNCWPT